MNGIHINWTKVYEQRHPGQEFQVKDYELLTTILSALSWRRHNGSIQMVTDSKGHDYYMSLGLEHLWDNGITKELDKFQALPINPDYFWAAGKIMALSLQKAPIVMIDTDFILWKSIDFRYFGSNVATIHREDINDIYPGPDYFLMHPAYTFPKDFNWNTRPCNTAFTYIGNQCLLEQYTQESLTFMLHALAPDDYITYMVFAEQRLLPMCAERLGLQIYDFGDLDHLFYSGQDAFTHIWGYKSRLDSDRKELDFFCKKCIQHIKKEYPWFMDTLQKIQQLERYL